MHKPYVEESKRKATKPISAPRAAAFVLGLTMFVSVFIAMPVLMLACFAELNLTLPAQIASVLLPTQMLNMLLSEHHYWAFSVVLNFALFVGYTVWLATQTWPMESPVPPMPLFYTLIAFQVIALSGIVHQQLKLAQFRPAERLMLAEKETAEPNRAALGTYRASLYLCPIIPVAQLILGAIVPGLSMHLLLVFTMAWPYILVIALFKRRDGIEALNWLATFLCIWQLLHMLTVSTFNLAPVWALGVAGSLALLNVVAISVSAFSIGSLRKIPPAIRLSQLANYAAQAGTPSASSGQYMRSFNSVYQS